MIEQQQQAGTCKYCGREIETIPGKRAREYCSDSHKQLAYKKRLQVKPFDQAQGQEHTDISIHAELEALRAQMEGLRTQNTALQKYVRDKDVEIDDQAAQIARLRSHVDVERRFLTDTAKRPFKAFLKKQPSTPFIDRFLLDPLFKPIDTLAHYEYRVRLNSTEDELRQFVTLWKLMLLDTLS